MDFYLIEKVKIEYTQIKLETERQERLEYNQLHKYDEGSNGEYIVIDTDITFRSQTGSRAWRNRRNGYYGIKSRILDRNVRGKTWG